MGLRLYQDSNFDVAEIAGQVPGEFLALGQSADTTNTETLVMRRDRWHRCFLEAFIGFWEVLSDEQIADLFDDYAGGTRVYLLARFELGGQRVLQATCQRIAVEGAHISIMFERGAVILREKDPSDPDSASVLEFRAA
jgi:hypothetical protein